MRGPRARRPWNWRKEIGWPLIGLCVLALIVWLFWPSDVEIEPGGSSRSVEKAIELKRQRLIESGYSEQAADRIIREDEGG